MILQLVATTVLRTLNDLRSQQFSQLIHVRSPYFVRARLSPGVVGKAFVLNCLCRLRARKDKKDSKYISALVGAPLKEVCRGPSKLLNPRKTFQLLSAAGDLETALRAQVCRHLGFKGEGSCSEGGCLPLGRVGHRDLGLARAQE